MNNQDHGSRISRAEAEIRELRKGQEVIFSKLDATAGKLDAITAALHELRGGAGPSVRDMMTMVFQGSALFGMVVAGILYLAAGTASKGVSDLEARMTRLETIIGMATVRRPTPGAWVPDTAWGR